MNKIFNEIFIVAAAAAVLSSVSVHASEYGVPESKLICISFYLI